MDQRTSAYLDSLRTIAAALVFVSHLSAPAFAGIGLPNFPLLHAGREGVMIFFVLSGYVIAYVADQREHDPLDFLISRLARLYSVVLPALVLVPLLDFVGRQFDPTIYAEISAGDRWPVRVFANAFFLQTIWFLDIRYFSDGPMWSMGYEFWFYMIFLAAVLVRASLKLRIALATSLLAFVGPKIAAYLLFWIAGAAVYHLHQRTAGERRSPAWFLLSIAAFLIAVTFGSNIFPEGAIGTFLYDALIASISAFNIWAFAFTRWTIAPWMLPTIRYLASISFALYLFHYPLLYFYRSVFGLAESSAPIRVVVASALTLLSVAALSYITEYRKNDYKRGLVRLRALVGPRLTT